MAWPLVSISAFRLALGHIERTESGEFTRQSSKLSRELLEHLQPLSRGLSLDFLSQLRDAIWFNVQEPPSARTRRRTIPLVEFIHQCTNNRLEFSGERVLLRSDPEHSLAEAVHRWRWLSLSLPGDFIIAAHAARIGQEPPADHVTLGAPVLDDFFAKNPLAQTHLHLGAAIPFERLWTNLMTRVGNEGLTPKQLKGNAGFEDPREFLCWLVTAALARLSLASFLFRRESGRADSLEECLRRFVDHSRHSERHLAAMTALARGSHPMGFAELRGILRRLVDIPSEDVSSEPLDALRRRDPLFQWLGPAAALPETRFITRGLRYLRETADGNFALLFWQYLRIRNLTYRHLVLRPGTGGLDWFSTHFQNISPLRIRMDERDRVTSALELDSRGAKLASLEVRTSPTAHWGEIRDLGRQIQKASSLTDPKVACGLVLHFIKAPHTSRPDKLPNADPRQRAHGCRFGAYFHAREQEVIAIETALRRHPRLLEVIRGMDVCHLELVVPTWVFVPLFARLRATSARIAHATGGALQPLRLTMHAGEEFRRLNEGLRLIHEPVEFGVMHEGDRLGHAVALGIEPGAWCKATPFAPQPAEDHLDDLLWEMARYRRSEMVPTSERRTYIERQLARLGNAIYGGSPDVEDLLRARELRHDPSFLAAVGYPFMRWSFRGEQWGAAGELALRYLSDFGVYERGRDPERINTHPTEAATLEQAQWFLRRVLAECRLTVEANPTSNMLIGELQLDRHPIFRLQPVHGHEAGGGAPVAVALGSDDPVTLATCLPDEFAYLYFELIRNGVTTELALDWLSRIAANGMQARFTVK